MTQEVQRFEIELEGEQNLSFMGKLLATVSESGPDPDTLSVYSTDQGNFVGVRESGYESTKTLTAEVSHSESGMFEFFGFDDLAKSLYREWGIDATKRV